MQISNRVSASSFCRVIDDQVELIITKASPERLLQQLLVDNPSENCSSNGSSGDSGNGGELHDSHFVEDFLLMHRVFFHDSAQIAQKLLNWSVQKFDTFFKFPIACRSIAACRYSNCSLV